jgi:hypothetical protein
MQDINPNRKNIPVRESDLPDSVDLREQAGIASTQESSQMSRVNFSSLYTPESRRNVVRNQESTIRRDYDMNYKKQKKVSATAVVIGFALILLLLGLLLYTFVFNSATVKIVPVRQTVPVEGSLAFTSEDVAIGEHIKMVTATSSKSVSVPRRAASKVETKASGTITIYNSFDKNPQKLITNTRFESKEGKIYRIAESITVPGMSGNTPGSIDATVYADSTGDTYNINSTELTIPGFKGTARYSKFSAKTKTALSGGFSGTQETVADEDIAKAKTEIGSALEQEAKENLVLFNPGDDYILMAESIRLTRSDNKNALATDKNLEYTETVSATGYFISKDFISAQVLSKLDVSEEEKKALRIEDFTQITFVKNTSNDTSSVFKVNMNGEATYISDLDESIIASALTGSKKSDFAETMQTFPGIMEAKPVFKPMWLTRFPGDTKQIHLEILK